MSNNEKAISKVRTLLKKLGVWEKVSDEKFNEFVVLDENNESIKLFYEISKIKWKDEPIKIELALWSNVDLSVKKIIDESVGDNVVFKKRLLQVLKEIKEIENEQPEVVKRLSKNIWDLLKKMKSYNI